MVGVADDGSVRGTTLGRETLNEWLGQIKSGTSPSIIPEETGSGLLVTFEIKADITPPVTPPITGLELKILGLLKDDPQLSSSQLAALLSIGRDTVREYLGRLKRKGVLVREGAPRSGRWVVRWDGRNHD